MDLRAKKWERERREEGDEEKRWSEWFKERERERVNGVKTET